MQRIHVLVAPTQRARAVWPAMLLAVSLGLGLGACDNLVEVDNPNNVLQGDLEEPESAGALVNGALGNTAEALADVIVAHATMSDETDWVGSQNGAGELERGQIHTNANDYSTEAFNELSTARWLSDYAVELLQGFEANGEELDLSLLGRVHLYAGINYEMIADMFDDFTFSDRQEAGPPIGEENMHTVYDTAIAHLNSALEIAEAEGDADLQLTALAMRARAKWAKAVWYKLNPKGEGVPHDGPLVNDADVNADAEAVLAMIPGPDWMYRFTYSTESNDNPFAAWVNSRHEVIFGPEFADWDKTGLKNCYPGNPDCDRNGIALLDPIDGIQDPVLASIIFEFIDGYEYSPLTVVSAREMHLILAEAALAASGGTASAEFVEHINAVRALADGLSAYDPNAPGAVDPLELLKHERLVNLFIQTRRLADMYRFQEPAEEWVANAEARTAPGTFFMIGQEEALSNCYILGTC